MKDRGCVDIVTDYPSTGTSFKMKDLSLHIHRLSHKKSSSLRQPREMLQSRQQSLQS